MENLYENYLNSDPESFGSPLFEKDEERLAYSDNQADTLIMESDTATSFEKSFVAPAAVKAASTSVNPEAVANAVKKSKEEDIPLGAAYASDNAVKSVDISSFSPAASDYFSNPVSAKISSDDTEGINSVTNSPVFSINAEIPMLNSEEVFAEVAKNGYYSDEQWAVMAKYGCRWDNTDALLPLRNPINSFGFAPSFGNYQKLDPHKKYIQQITVPKEMERLAIRKGGMILFPESLLPKDILESDRDAANKVLEYERKAVREEKRKESGEEAVKHWNPGAGYELCVNYDSDRVRAYLDNSAKKIVVLSGLYELYGDYWMSLGDEEKMKAVSEVGRVLNLDVSDLSAEDFRPRTFDETWSTDAVNSIMKTMGLYDIYKSEREKDDKLYYGTSRGERMRQVFENPDAHNPYEFKELVDYLETTMTELNTRSFGSRVGRGVFDSARFMAEMFVTSPLSAVAGTAITGTRLAGSSINEIIGSFLKGGFKQGFGKAALALSAGELARLPAYFPGEMAETYSESLGNIGLTVVDGEVVPLAEKDDFSDDGERMFNKALSRYIENLSEGMGEFLPTGEVISKLIPKKVKNRFVQSSLSRVLARATLSDKAKIAKELKMATGFNGFLGELTEEELGKSMEFVSTSVAKLFNTGYGNLGAERPWLSEDELIETAVSILIQSAFMSSGNVASLMGDRKRSVIFTENHETLHDKIEESKTAGRSPEKMEELLRISFGTNDRASITPDKARTLYQTVPEIMEGMGVTEDAINEAEKNEKTIPILLSKVHTSLIGANSADVKMVLGNIIPNGSVNLVTYDWAKNLKIDDLYQTYEDFKSIRPKLNEARDEMKRVLSTVYDDDTIDAFLTGVMDNLVAYLVTHSTDEKIDPVKVYKSIVYKTQGYTRASMKYGEAIKNFVSSFPVDSSDNATSDNATSDTPNTTPIRDVAKAFMESEVGGIDSRTEDELVSEAEGITDDTVTDDEDATWSRFYKLFRKFEKESKLGRLSEERLQNALERLRKDDVLSKVIKNADTDMLRSAILSHYVSMILAKDLRMSEAKTRSAENRKAWAEKNLKDTEKARRKSANISEENRRKYAKKRDELNAKLLEAKKELAEKRLETSKLEALAKIEMAAAKKNEGKRDTRVKELQAQLEEALNAVERLVSEANDLDAQIDEAKEAKKNFDMVSEKLNKAEAERQQLLEKIDALKESDVDKAILDVLSKKQKELDKKDKKIEELRAERDKALERAGSLKGKLRKKNAKIEDYKSAIAILEEERKLLKADLRTARSSQTKLQNKLEKLKEKEEARAKEADSTETPKSVEAFLSAKIEEEGISERIRELKRQITANTEADVGAIKKLVADTVGEYETKRTESVMADVKRETGGTFFEERLKKSEQVMREYLDRGGIPAVKLIPWGKDRKDGKKSDKRLEPVFAKNIKGEKVKGERNTVTIDKDERTGLGIKVRKNKVLTFYVDPEGNFIDKRSIEGASAQDAQKALRAKWYGEFVPKLVSDALKYYSQDKSIDSEKLTVFIQDELLPYVLSRWTTGTPKLVKGGGDEALILSSATPATFIRNIALNSQYGGRIYDWIKKNTESAVKSGSFSEAVLSDDSNEEGKGGKAVKETGSLDDIRAEDERIAREREADKVRIAKRQRNVSETHTFEDLVSAMENELELPVSDIDLMKSMENLLEELKKTTGKQVSDDDFNQLKTANEKENLSFSFSEEDKKVKVFIGKNKNKKEVPFATDFVMSLLIRAMTPGKVESLARLPKNSERYQKNPEGQEIKGKITFDRYDSFKSVVTLYNGASDITTLVHETAHHFFNYVEQLVNQGLADETMIQDYNNLKAWASENEASARSAYVKYVREVNKREGNPLDYESWKKVRFDEKLAMGFETYVMEGKAPNAMSERGFARLRRMMLNVYQSRNALGIKLDDNVRAAFESMLSADKAYKNGIFYQTLTGIMDTLSSLASTSNSKELKALSELAKKAGDKLLSSLIKKRKEASEKFRPQWRKQAEEIVNGSPIYQIWNDIVKNGGLGRELVKKIGEDALAVLSRKGLIHVRKRGDRNDTNEMGYIPTDLLAKYYKSRNPLQQMVLDLMKADSPSQFVRDYVNQKEEALNSSFEIDHRFDTADEELDALEALGEFLGKLSGSTGVRQMFREAMKQKAFDEMRVMTVNDILNERSMKYDCLLSSKNLIQNINDGKYEQAFGSAENLRMNLIRLRSLTEYQKDLRKTMSLLKASVSLERGKMDGTYQNGLIELASKLGLTERPVPETGLDKAVEEFNAYLVESGADELDTEWLPGVFRRAVMKDDYSSYRIPSFGRIRLNDALLTGDLARMLYGKGREIVSKEHESFKDKCVGDEQLAVVQMNEDSSKEYSGRFRLLKQARWLMLLGTKLRNIVGEVTGWNKDRIIAQHYAEEVMMAGKQDAMFNRVKRIIEKSLKVFSGKGNMDAMKKQIADSGIELSFPDRLMRERDYGKLAPTTLLCLALNMGTQKNRQRLIDGFTSENGIWSENTLDRIASENGIWSENTLDRIASENGIWSENTLDRIASCLTEEQWNCVQEIWDAIGKGEMADEVKAMYRKQFFCDMKEEKASPFRVKTADGKVITVRGGYYPLSYTYSTNRFTEARREQSSKADIPSSAYRAPFTFYRAEKVSDPVELSLSVLLNHVFEATHYATHWDGMRRIVRVTNGIDFKTTFQKRFGYERYKAYKMLTDFIANPREEATSEIDKMFRIGRSVMVARALYLSPSAFLKQGASLTYGLNEIGFKHYFGALASFASHPFATTKAVKEMSGFMASRESTRDIDLEKVLFELDKGKLQNGARFAQRFGFWFMGKYDMAVAVPAWLGMYNKCVSEGKTETEAIALADELVASAQGGARPIDLSPVQLSEVGRVATVFFSAVSAGMARSSDTAKRTVKGKASASEIAMNLILPMIFEPIAVFVLHGGVPELFSWFGLGDGLDDDDEGKMWRSVLSTALAWSAQGIPVVRDVADYTSRYAASKIIPGGKDNLMEVNIEGNASARGIEDVARLFSQALKDIGNQDPASFAYDLADAVSTVYRVPMLTAYNKVARWANVGLGIPEEYIKPVKPERKNSKQKKDKLQEYIKGSNR